MMRQRYVQWICELFIKHISRRSYYQFYNIMHLRGTTDSFENQDQDNMTSTLASEFLRREPAIEVPRKPYSLQPDIAMGWVPKMKIIGPIPLNFDSPVTDSVVTSLLQHKSLINYYRVAYLGSRPHNTFRMHEEFSGSYTFKYEHLYKNNYNHLQPFYKKFYSEFQPKTERTFKGMNKGLTQSQNEVIFDSNFEGGNLDAVIRVAKGEYDIFIRVDSNTRGHLQWYDFKVKNISLQKIKINIVNLSRKKTLYERGMKPFIKAGDNAWSQGGTNVAFKEIILRYEFLKDDYSELDLTFKELSFEYKFTKQHQQVQFAYSVPYQYSRVVKLIQDLQVQNRQEILKQKILCESLSGLDLQLLTITDPDIPNKSKKCIFVIARQHPGEANGSFVMEGFLKWVCSDTPQAIRLRQIAVIKAVPMINPDGVVLGNFRTSICGKDLNRLFRKKNTFMFPEVQQLKAEIINTKKQFKEKFLLFMDFHGHSVKKNVFTYGPGFNLGENNYYKSRIFPKIIANQTKMFRYYSCSFRISQHKQATARALISKYVPYCYTVQSSNSSYYCHQTRNNIDFVETDWLSVGRDLGISSLLYLQMIIDEEREARVRIQKIKEKRQAREHRNYKQKDNESDVDQQLMSSTKRSGKAAVTSKSLGNKRIVKQTLQFIAGNTNPVQSSISQPAPKHFPPLPAVYVKKYNQNSLIQQIRQIENDLTAKSEDNQSDKFQEGGSDSESQSDDLPELALKRFQKAASRMILEFEYAFLKRNNSELTVPRSRQTTATKKKPTKQKQKKIDKDGRQGREFKEIHVMACLKSKVHPIVESSPLTKINKIEKFKSFQMLEPLGKTSSIKQLISEGKQKIPAFNLKQPLKAFPPPLARVINMKNIINERLEKIDPVQSYRLRSLQRIDEQADSHLSGQISACVRQYQNSEIVVRDIQTEGNKFEWWNAPLTKRDQKSEYMEQARERLQEYLIKENVGTSYDKQFLGTKIRVRNVSRTRQKQI